MGCQFVWLVASEQTQDANMPTWNNVLQSERTSLCQQKSFGQGSVIFHCGNKKARWRQIWRSHPVRCHHFPPVSLWESRCILAFDRRPWVPVSLDNLMKSRCSSRLGTVGSAKPISFEDETKVWVSGALGEDSPDKLRNTVMFLIGISCALRGGDEHRCLRCPPHDPQIVMKKDLDGMPYLIYTEDDKSKTFQGGINSCPKKRKVMPIHGNKIHPERNLVRLYQKYISLLPPNGKCQALYKYSLSLNRLTPGTLINRWESMP